MISYLIYDTEKEAEDRSREAWLQVLGRPWVPGDTEFLWGRSLPGKDGRVAVIIPDDTTKWNITEAKATAVSFTAKEQTDKIAQLDKTNWPDPVLIAAQVETP